MALVRVQVAGGSPQMKTASTVGELAKQLGVEGYQATKNGEPAEYSEKLYGEDGSDFVTFAKPSKAG